MKNKIISSIILLILFLTTISSLSQVEAYVRRIATAPEPTSTQTPTPTPSDSQTTVDFTKAKFELKKEGMSDAIVEISDVTIDENNSYYLVITNSSSKPNVENFSYTDGIFLSYDKTTEKLKTENGDKVANFVELNQDLYASVVEAVGDEYSVVKYGEKLKRFDEPKYTDAFFATFVVEDSTQIITNFTHGEANNRKMQIKFGKITDNSILKKIKNEDSSAFENLLSYAKSNSGIFNQNLEACKNSGFAIEYNTNRDSAIKPIELKGLQNQAYYYLYIKTDDENGKYISNETVTLGQANTFTTTSRWSISFYGTGDFKWADFEGDTTSEPSKEKDNTQASGNLPQTGISTYILTFGTITLIVGGFIAYIKYKKYNF